MAIDDSRRPGAPPPPPAAFALPEGRQYVPSNMSFHQAPRPLPRRRSRAGGISVLLIAIFLTVVLVVARTPVSDVSGAPPPAHLAWVPASAVYLVQGTTPSAVASDQFFPTEPRAEVYWAVRSLAGLSKYEFSSFLFIHTGRAPVTILRSAQAERAYQRIQSSSLRSETIATHNALIVNRPTPKPLVQDPNAQWGVVRIDEQTLVVGEVSAIKEVLDVIDGRAPNILRSRPQLAPVLQSFGPGDEAMLQMPDEETNELINGAVHLSLSLVPEPVKLFAGPAAEMIAMGALKHVDPQDCSAAYVMLFAGVQSATNMETFLGTIGTLNGLVGGDGLHQNIPGIGSSDLVRAGNMVRLNLYPEDRQDCALQTR